MKLLPASLVTLAAAQATWCRWVPLASQQYVPQCALSNLDVFRVYRQGR